MSKRLKCLLLCAGIVIVMGCSMTTHPGGIKAPPKAVVEPSSKIECRTLSVPYYGEVKVPASMPDFAHDFDESLLPFSYSATICAIAFLTGEFSPPFGSDSYELIGLCSECKVLVLACCKGAETKFWIYDDDGNPIGASADEVLNLLGMPDTDTSETPDTDTSETPYL